jgi:DNA replication protein DnaC
MKLLREAQGNHVAEPVVKTLATAVDQRLSSSRTLTAEEVAELQRKSSDAAFGDLFRSACVPRLHAEKLAAVSDVVGPWREKLDYLKAKLGSGFLIGLLGVRGTGKTQLAVQLLAECCRSGQRCHYIKALDLFRDIRACFRDDGPNERETVRRFSGYKLLVVDEAHERSHNDFERRTLTNILDHRYDARVDTLLVSNETLEAFTSAIGPSVVSRINEVGEVIECTWPSFR